MLEWSIVSDDVDAVVEGAAVTKAALIHQHYMELNRRSSKPKTSSHGNLSYPNKYLYQLEWRMWRNGKCDDGNKKKSAYHKHHIKNLTPQ